MSECLKGGHKVLAFGNGGSAADAQHLAAELVGRNLYDRPGLPALALTTDTSALTAIGNDMGYDSIFRRQVEAHGLKGDVAIGITTSGRSRNVVDALRVARERGLTTIALTGGGGGVLKDAVDYLVDAPSTDTAHPGAARPRHPPAVPDRGGDALPAVCMTPAGRGTRRGERRGR